MLLITTRWRLGPLMLRQLRPDELAEFKRLLEFQFGVEVIEVEETERCEN